MDKKIELVTKRFLLKDVMPEFAKTIAKEFGKGEEDLQFIRKGFEPSDIKFSDGENSSVDYITTKSIDRDGEIVDPDGAVLDMFRKHPVVVWAHDYKSLPLGKSAWIKKDDKGLISKTIYAVNSNPFAKQVYEYRKDGFPLGKSIGFVPLEWEDFDPKKTKGLKKKYNKWLMLEYSDVPIPSNADALQIAVSKGLIKAEQLKELAESFPIETKSDEKKNIFFCETCEEETEFKELEDGSFVCIKCNTKLKPKKKETEDEEIEQKAGKEEKQEEELFIECPECGEDVEYKEGDKEVECPECGEIIEIEAEPEEEEKEIGIDIIEQKRYKEGNPSIYDIIAEITRKLSLSNNSILNEKPIVVSNTSEYYVDDLYPTNYPSGSFVFMAYEEGKRKLFSADYIFENGEVISISNVAEVQDEYVKKSFEEREENVVNEFFSFKIKELVTNNNEMIDEIDYLSEKIKAYAEEVERLNEVEEEFIHLKEGRVLSGRNRTLIKNCLTQMDEAINVLNELMEATSTEKEIEEDFIEIKETEKIEMKSVDDLLNEITKEDIEKITLKAASAVKQKLDIGAIINKVEAKMKGKVI